MMVSSAPISAAKMLIRTGMGLAVVGIAGFIVTVPVGSLPGMVVSGLLEGLGFGLSWPSIVRRIVHLSDQNERILAAAAPATVQRIGFAVGAAATGIAANMSGLADGISVEAARAAGFWVFAGFIPVLVVGVFCLWWFTTTEGQRPLSS